MTTTLAAPQRGLTTVAERAVGRIATRAAHEVTGVAGATASAHVTGGVAALDVRLDLHYPAPVPATTAAVRAHLAERVGLLTGLAVSVVDVSVAVLRTAAEVSGRVR
ncbi:Asp23/Gls24 family envelope stress response protein [Lentzea chajnantorensis]